MISHKVTKAQMCEINETHKLHEFFSGILCLPAVSLAGLSAFVAKELSIESL